MTPTLPAAAAAPTEPTPTPLQEWSARTGRQSEVGWICPKCGAVYSPWVAQCDRCRPKPPNPNEVKMEHRQWTE